MRIVDAKHGYLVQFRHYVPIIPDAVCRRKAETKPRFGIPEQ